MNEILSRFKKFLSDRFTLSEDKADESVIIESIRKDVSFKGTNLWTLIFAIIIASIGLNVNSTAVIIGAMLISPLMGPIMGIGLSIGINDIELLKKGAKNLFIAAAISIATSSLYFTITPLHDASSELLARTTPTIWDVFIAFVGGLAGIVAGTRKQKGNVIPGVSIATALMPPLCTAGFGIATGQWLYFLGALYLFFINSLFICLATFLIVKRLRFHKANFTTPENEKRVSRYILTIVILTILPSIYLAYRIVQRSIFENNAERFVTTEFHFNKTQVVTKKYIFTGKQHKVELLLVGQSLSETVLDSIQSHMPAYHLQNTTLIVHQGLDAKQKIDLSAIKASVLEEINADQNNKDVSRHSDSDSDNLMPDITGELKILYPDLIAYSITPAVFTNAESLNKDSATLFVAKFRKQVPINERNKLEKWIKQRIHADSLMMVIN